MTETLSNFDNASSVRDREAVLIDPTQNENKMQVWTQRVTDNTNKEMAELWDEWKIEKTMREMKNGRRTQSVSNRKNQSRMCGKGVGLGLFPSEVEKWPFFDHFWANFGYVSHIPAIRFWCHCTYRTLIWCTISVENFVRIVWTLFEKIEKSRKMAVFWPFLG